MAEACPYIMNVDDNEAVRYARTRILERAGYQVVEVGTGLEALALIRRDRPALVVLDVNLPDSSGIDICQQIRQDPATADALVLQISACYTTSESRIAGLDCGADAYLTEPVPAEEFLATAKALLRRFPPSSQVVAKDPEGEQPIRQEIAKAEELIRVLSSKLAAVKEKEQEKLAQSLHDDLAQLLVVARLKLHQHGYRPPALSVKEVDTILEQCLTYTRSLMSDLMPPEMSNGRLDVALRWLAARMRDHGLTVALDLPDEAIVLAEETAMTVLKGVRELLFNVLKHAGTREAFVTLALRDGSIQIAVQDEGKGYNASSADGPVRRSFGLISVRARMESLRGQFDITSEHGAGTCATLIFPYTHAGANNLAPPQ